MSAAAAGQTAAPLLQGADLVRSFGALKAVGGCSLDLMPGTVTGLIGPNGSGKSTLIDVLSGTLRQDSGSVRFQGEDISRWPVDRRARAGLVRTFQSARLWPQLSVAENLLAAGPARGRNDLWRTLLTPRSLKRIESEEQQRAGAILESLNLWRLRDDHAVSLSGGQSRLIEFGRILMSGATVALLDEPLAGVNPVMADEVMAGIRHLAEQGVTLLMVEHNLRVVKDLCTEVIGMAVGKIMIRGTVDEIAASEFFSEAYLGTSLSRGTPVRGTPVRRASGEQGSR